MHHTLKDRYLRLILCGFSLKDGELLVSKAYLIFKGMKDTIMSLVSQAKKNKSKKWISHTLNNRQYIEVNSIPSPTLKRLELDFPQDVLKELLITHGYVEDKKVLESIKAEAYLILTTELRNYKKHLFNFYDIIVDKKERKRLAKTYAILSAILPFIQKYPRGMYGYFYDLLKGAHIHHNIPLSSLNYFYKYIGRIDREGVLNGIIHGLTGEPSNASMGEEITNLITFFKGQGNPTSTREVLKNVERVIRKYANLKHLIEKIPDERTVRDFLASKESKNRTAISLLDYNAFESKILGYLPTYKAYHPLTKVFIDGYIIQVYCANDETLKPITLVGVFMMDDYSRHVVCEIGEVENSVLIGKTLETFLHFTKYRLPYEVISDKFSSYQFKKAFPNFKKFIKDNKLKWTRSTNPKRKAPLERWFGSWQSCSLSKIVNWKGEGLKSRRPYAHPSRAVVLMVTQEEFLKGKNEMIRHLKASVDDYNKNSFFVDAPSPLDLYRLKKPKHVIQLQDYHVPYFFWDKHQVSINGSMVIVQKSYDIEDQPRPKEEDHQRQTKTYLKKWFYRCADFDFSLKNGEKIDAYHSPEDDKFLYLFERDSHTFITTIEKQIVARGASGDQNKIDEKIIADFGISKAKLHQAYINEMDKIHDHVKTLTGVTDLSELNEKAQAKKDADDYVGNKVGITSPTPEPKMHESHKWNNGRKPVARGKKTKRRPKTGINDSLG